MNTTHGMYPALGDFTLLFLSFLLFLDSPVNQCYGMVLYKWYRRCFMYLAGLLAQIK